MKTQHAEVGRGRGTSTAWYRSMKICVVLFHLQIRNSRNLYVALQLLAIPNEALDPGMLNSAWRSITNVRQVQMTGYFYLLTVIDMATVKNFEVISDICNEIWIDKPARGNYAQHAPLNYKTRVLICTSFQTHHTEWLIWRKVGVIIS
jgi:hypothetical protein